LAGDTISPVIDAIKNNLLFYVLLPLNRGMTSVATPKIWGIELTPAVITTYVLLLAVVAGALARRFGWPAGAAIVSLGVVYYFGTTNLPWLVVFLVVIGLAHQVAGWRLASFAGAALAFMLVSGVWREVMMSIYLCGVAVFLSCVIGIPLGIWAALNDRVSATVRPIIDTLQTMPQFVFLIPVVMLFKVGELPALIAMVSMPWCRQSATPSMASATCAPMPWRRPGPSAAPAGRSCGACTAPGGAGDHARHEPDHHVRPLHARDLGPRRHPRPRPIDLQRAHQWQHGQRPRSRRQHGAHRHGGRPHHAGLGRAPQGGARARLARVTVQ
jgi:hypothetical protein